MMPFITLPINSFRFNVNDSRSLFVNSYRQAIPVLRQYPPTPYSQESDTAIVVGTLNITELIDMPRCARWRNFIQSLRSLLLSGVIIAIPCLSAIHSSLRILLRKWRAQGMMYPMWLSRPTSVFASSHDIVSLFITFSIEFIHAITFTVGNAIIIVLEFISHPRKMIISRSLPSAMSLRMDCASGLGRGSSVPACGLNTR